MDAAGGDAEKACDVPGHGVLWRGAIQQRVVVAGQGIEVSKRLTIEEIPRVSMDLGHGNLKISWRVILTPQEHQLSLVVKHKVV
jgi:hypothetical protein